MCHYYPRMTHYDAFGRNFHTALSVYVLSNELVITHICITQRFTLQLEVVKRHTGRKSVDFNDTFYSILRHLT